MDRRKIKDRQAYASQRGIMQTEPGPVHHFTMRISRRGPDVFGWNICREADSIELHHSTSLFATRIEALLDSAHAAATLAIAGNGASSTDSESINVYGP
jgi:hypothetical protein